MSSGQVVAFDGTPLVGGAGMRVAILELQDGTFVTRAGRRLRSEELKRLIREGYVTSIPPIDANPDGVVVYRHAQFEFPKVTLANDGVTWLPCGDIQVSYLRPREAAKILDDYARLAYLSGHAALRGRAFDDVRRFVRRGLMVAQDLRRSKVAAQLYGVLLAAETLSGQPQSVTREIEIMLDKELIATALEEASTALHRPRSQPSELRRADRRLEVGTLEAPREAA